MIADQCRVTQSTSMARSLTEPGGQPFAGGGEVPTPFGIYFSPNITPDKKHGIGSWTEEEFLRALRQGMSTTGRLLFPVFPYTSFTGMSDQDIPDIRAYPLAQIARGVADKPHDVKFPYDVRSAMVFWRILYFTRACSRQTRSKSPEWNRGRYLAEAVVHCGECHTPRNFLGALERGQLRRGHCRERAGGKWTPTSRPTWNRHRQMEPRRDRERPQARHHAGWAPSANHACRTSSRGPASSAMRIERQSPSTSSPCRHFPASTIKVMINAGAGLFSRAELAKCSHCGRAARQDVTAPLSPELDVTHSAHPGISRCASTPNCRHLCPDPPPWKPPPCSEWPP